MFNRSILHLQFMQHNFMVLLGNLKTWELRRTCNSRIISASREDHSQPHMIPFFSDVHKYTLLLLLPVNWSHWMLASWLALCFSPSLTVSVLYIHPGERMDWGGATAKECWGQICKPRWWHSSIVNCTNCLFKILRS